MAIFRKTTVTFLPTGQGQQGEQKVLTNVVPEPNTRTGMLEFISDGLMRKPVLICPPNLIQYIEVEEVKDEQ